MLIKIRTNRVGTFPTDLQEMYVGVCQHIDWLIEQTGEPIHRISYAGSESWTPGVQPFGAKVAVKAFMWNQKMKLPRDNPRKSGVAVLLRDDGLNIAAMHQLRKIYHVQSLPTSEGDLFGCIPNSDRTFRGIFFALGSEACDLSKLPGVDLSPAMVRARLAEHVPKGTIVVGRAAAGQSGTGSRRLAGGVKGNSVITVKLLSDLIQHLTL